MKKKEVMWFLVSLLVRDCLVWFACSCKQLTGGGSI